MNPIKLLKKSDEGLTLIELMAALVILTFGVVAALSILVEAHKANRLTRTKTMAINAAEEVIETILRDDPASVTGYGGRTFPVGKLVGPGNGNPGLVTVTGADPYLVTVTVTWQGQGILPAGTVTVRAVRSAANRT